jgi:hypothetical protein
MTQSGFPSEESASCKGATYGWQEYFASLERAVWVMA